MSQGSALGDYLDKQEKNPAAPAGAQQMASHAGDGSKLGTWLTKTGSQAGQGYVEGSQSWFTGANAEGTNNGWDSQFTDDFMNGWNQALEQGSAANYFSSPTATGVVTWDHASEDGTKSYTFGDVYEKGQFKGNVYKMYDRDTANLMMTPWVLDRETQLQTFSASDRMPRLDREIEAQRTDRTNNFTDQIKAAEFNKATAATAKDFEEGHVDEAITGGTALGGAALGAGVGSFFPGPGTIIGGAIGGIAGGVGGYLNRDSLTEQAARAYEITKMSSEENGTLGGIATGVHEWSGFGGKMISPVSNLTQGTYDALSGKGGDGKSEFYATDETGKNKAPTWVKALDVGGTVADSMLQFSNPVGIGLYTTQMGGTIGGEVSELGLTGGKTFDYSRGGFDNIFTDENGKFSPTDAMAGIANIGIDVVQMGMARGLVGKANALREGVGETALAPTLGSRVGDKLPLWMGGSRGLAAGESRVREAGFSFTRGAEGQIVEGSRRATLGLLAPSEQLNALSSRVIGLRQAALRAEGRASYSADDFYNAAHALSHGERTIQTALVTALGEGYEEAAQAILEPVSHDQSVDYHQIMQSFIYGAAAGGGMGGALGLRSPNADERMFAQAKLNTQMGRGTAISRDEWNALPDIDKRQLASLSDTQRQVSEAAYTQLADALATEQFAGVSGIAKVRDSLKSMADQAKAKATVRTDGAFVITQLEQAPALDENGDPVPGAVPQHAVTGSAAQTGQLLTQHLRGMAIARDQIADRLKVAQAQVEADPENADAVDQVASRTRQLQITELTLTWGERISRDLDRILDSILSTDSPDELAAEVMQANDMLKRAYHLEIADYGGEALTEDDKLALARAVSLVFVRDPQDQRGSYQALLPQISVGLTSTNSNNVLEVSHGILTPLSGDYDGDKVRQQAQQIIDDAAFTNLRAGLGFLGAGNKVAIGTPKFERYPIEYLAEGLTSDNNTVMSFARETMNGIAAAVRNRYEGYVDERTLEKILTTFEEHVAAGDVESRDALIGGLAREASSGMTKFGRERLTNEWLWLDQLVVSSFQRFQEAYAAHRPSTQEVNVERVSPIHQETAVRERVQMQMATLGQTLAEFSPGDSLFRKFQHLHYSVINSPVLSAENVDPIPLSGQIALYRELAQATTRTEVEQAQGRDIIVRNVIAQLEVLARDFSKLHPSLNRHQAMLVVANTATQDFDFDDRGRGVEKKGQITLAQALLRMAVYEDQQENARVLEISDELQARHSRLLSMTRPSSNETGAGAAETMVEVFGSMQMYQLLGDQAGVFGPHLTLEQFVRQFSAMTEQERRDTGHKLRAEAAYVGKKNHPKALPYRLDDVEEISAYRATVDAVLKVGAARIAVDQHTGKIVGEIAERSRRTGDSYRVAHEQIRRALQEFVSMSGRRDGELSVDLVRRMLAANPDVERSLFDLIPNQAAAAVLTVKENGEVWAPNWLYEMFVMADAQEAEMHFYRNLLLSEWFAKHAEITEEGDEKKHSREYGRLDRRTHRIMYALAAYPDGGLLYQQFINKLSTTKSVDEWEKWVNTTPGIRHEGAPITAWVDDVAEFDADKAKGGWTTVLRGSELRESIAVLRRRTEGLVDSINDERAALQNDARARAAIRRVLRKDAGEDVVLLAGDRAMFDKFEAAIEFARDWYMTAGPRTMVQQTVGAVRGFLDKSHTKGVNPSNVAPIGGIEAQRDAFDYVVNYERFMGSLTAVTLDSVNSNPFQLSKGAGRSMDDYGRQVTWGRPTTEEMLNLLDNADTRPMARAMLFPQVMEVDSNNYLSNQFVTGKSLSELLRGASTKAVFPRDGYLSQEAAFKYLMLVEGVARQYGGASAVQQAVNDIVIARTASAGHPLSDGEIENMTLTAYREVAQVLQAVGSVQSQPREAGTNPLRDLYDLVTQAQRKVRVLRTLGLEADDAQTVDVVLDSFKQQKEAEFQADVIAIQEQMAAANDPTTVTLYEQMVDSLDAQKQKFYDSLDVLMSDDVAARVVEMFGMAGSPEQVGLARTAVATYILDNESMIGQSIANRVTLTKFNQQISDAGYAGQPKLTDAEWEELSRAVIGSYLDKVLQSPGISRTTRPWPDANHTDEQKYWDSSWSYLISDLLDEASPLTRAAAKIATSNYGPAIDTEDFLDLVGRTILDENRLGPWTSTIVEASVEARQRMLSASAEAAIAMAGNLPKRWNVIMASTRRTFEIPDDTMLSTVTLSAVDLNKDLFDEVAYTPPNMVGELQMPLAQLNNRFAKSVTIEIPDAEGNLQTFDAMDYAGREFFNVDSVRESGFKVIHMERLQWALDRIAGEHKLKPIGATIRIEFFHPDHQPADPAWYNNVYFEGTNFSLDADGYDSLAEGLVLSPNGLSQMAQRAALDASKTGKAALQVISGAPAEDVAALEAEWAVDFAGMLRKKTELMLTKDLGFGRLEPEFYNATYKNMKLRHFVRGERDGEAVLLSAEQVIAWQREHPGEPLDLANTQLWVPSDDVLRSMLGDQSSQGVTRVLGPGVEFDASQVPTYRGVTDQMLDWFRDGVASDPIDVTQTRVASRAREIQLTVNAALTASEVSQFSQRMQVFHERDERIFLDRQEAGFNSGETMRQATTAAKNMLTAENLSIYWARLGISFGPRNPEETAVTQTLLRNRNTALDPNDYRAGWIYERGSKGLPGKGLLSEVSLSHSPRDAYKVARDDLVVFKLDAYNGDIETAYDDLDYFIDAGANIVLVASDARTDMRVYAAEYLMGRRGYEQVLGAQHLYRPADRSTRYQNQRSRTTSLTATRPITTKNRAAMFMVQGREIQEGAAWSDPDNERLNAIGVVANLVPSNFLAGFNVPVEQFSNASQIEDVRAKVKGFDNADGRAFLKRMAHGKEKDKKVRKQLDREFDAAFSELIDRLDRNPGHVLPREGDEFGTGDFIPLVDSVGRLLLYRHGYKAPTRADVDEMTTLPRKGTEDPSGIAVFPSKREPNATTHRGTVVEFRNVSGYGLEVELNVDFQLFGSKQQLEANGLKLVLLPRPDSVVLPSHGFFENWGIDLITDLDSALGKEATEYTIDNHQMAFAAFGIDFLPDYTEFFFPGEGQNIDRQNDTRKILKYLATRVDRISERTAYDLVSSSAYGAEFIRLIPADLTDSLGVNGEWLARLSDQNPNEARITGAAIAYLLTPGARVEDVLRSGGFNNQDSIDPDLQSRLMPKLFTKIFDDARPGSPLRTEINRRLNSQVYNPNPGEGYVLNQDFTWETRNANGSKNLRGFLAFPEVHSAGDNPVKNGMAYDERERTGVSSHTAAIASGAAGLETAYQGSLDEALAKADEFNRDRARRDMVDGGIWNLLTDIPKKDRTFKPWHKLTPAEAYAMEMSREAMTQFRQALIMDENHGWSDTQIKKYRDLANTIVTRLGLHENQATVVDFWVRQMLGQPFGMDENEHDLGRVTGRGAVEVAEDILANVENHYLPIAGAEVPGLHIHDLQMIYRANRARRFPWLPRESMKNKTPVESWDDWTKVALGTMFTSDTLFDPMYRLALDGFMHTYQRATQSLMDLPVSLDALVSQKLLDLELNRMVVSLSEPADILAQQPMVLDADRATLDEVIGGRRISGKFRGKAAPASEVAKRRAARRKWRKEHGVPIPVDVTMRNFRKNGTQLIDDATTTNTLIRNLTHLRLGMALINPALYVSMGPEQWIRGSLDRIANLITAQGTTGRTAKILSNRGWSRYTPEQLTLLNQTYRTIGRRNDFKGMVYSSLGFHAEHGPGGVITRGLEKFARLGTSMQDPTYGMRGDTMARRYLEAALQHILATPTLQVISVEALASNLMTDPQWLRKNMPEAHQYGMNALAQIRSMKETVASQMIKGIIDPMAESGRPLVNAMSNVLLRIPMLFSNYAMNVATTLLGLQGLDQIVAMGLEGRQKGPNSFIGRVQAKLRGEEFDPDADAYFDMGSVIEGIDLSRAFIRGGLTHTGLFAAGLWAGGLGLSGEDDEMRRRRLLAQAQGVGNIYDPRRIENDFRNADAIYLDALPFGIGNLFDDDGETGRALVHMHWMVKQFVSPMMGMERFFETGDPRQITWGFQDALGAFPLVNTMMWHDAVNTADQLFADAADVAKNGDDASILESGNLMTHAVSTYERMLFENAFINTLYIGYDRYDRDPYVLPLTDSDGTLQRDIEGNARPQNLALDTFVDPKTHELRRGFLSEPGATASIKSEAENRATLAFVSSLFTGGPGNSDYWRYNMPIKTRTFEKDPVSVDEVHDLYLQGQGTTKPGMAFQQGAVTPEEVMPEVRNHLYQLGEKTGHFYTDAEIWRAAESAAASVNHGVSGATALATIESDGHEKPTLAGAKALFLGLYYGSVKLEDASLRGFYVTYEQRQQIQADWTKELIQEGIDLGLDKTKAISRMKRIWNGPLDNPEVGGIADIVWAPSEKLSYSKSQEFAQLNTTYVMDPSGRPIATGFGRDKLLQALGLVPGVRMVVPERGATMLDSRMNVGDLASGLNTGLRALEPLDDTRNVPTDVEIGKSIEKAIKDAAADDYTPFTPYDKSGSGSSGYGGYSSYGHGGSGGGGGSSYFNKMYSLPNNISVYANSMPFINTSNPIIRRADIRRERVWSERGRLNQWQ